LKTEIIRINPGKLEDKNELSKLQYAANVLQKGGLVAFPTETVYGLGANALDEASVKKIYAAKGRPSDNPLIVHIAELNDLSWLTPDIPPVAELLTAAFWPGPLTLVMKRSEKVPAVVSAGLETVAIRMPSHPVALKLISISGVPVAAPSANSSGKPSPTSAWHVIEDLFGKVDIIIDGGDVSVGLESTVLDITVSPPVILRPGGITPAQLAEIIGDVKVNTSLSSGDSPEGGSENEVPRAPGMKYRHYAPKAEMTVVIGKTDEMVSEILRLAKAYSEKNARTAILATDETYHLYSLSPETGNCPVIESMGSRNHPETIAHNLFRLLRQMDKLGIQYIFAESIPARGVGLAVMNRLLKASGYRIIKV